MMRVPRIVLISLWGLGLSVSMVLYVSGFRQWEIDAILLGFLGSFTAMSLRPSDLGFYTSIFVVLEFAIKPFILAQNSQFDIVAANLRTEWSIVLFFQLIAYGAFIIGYLIFSRSEVGKHFAQTKTPTGLFLLLMYLTIWIARLYVLSFQSTNNILGTIANLSPLVVSSALVIVLKTPERRTYFLLILLFAGDVLWAYMSKTKLIVITDIVCLLYLYSNVKRVKFRYLVLIPLLGILFVGALEAYRDPYIYGEMNWFVAGLSDLVQRSDNFDTAVRVFAYTPASVPFWGWRMLEALFQTIAVPFPFPGKINMPSGNLVAQYYYGFNNSHLYIGLGLSTSWYITFGMVASFVAMLIIGMVVAGVFNVSTRLVNRGWFMFGIVISAVVSFSDIEQSYFDIIDHFVKNSLLVAVFALVSYIFTSATSTQLSNSNQLNRSRFRN